MQITLDLPEDLFSKKTLPRKVLEGLVLLSYNSGKISGGMVAKILGLSRYEADGFLKKNGAVNKYSLADLNKEISASKKKSK